MSRNKIYVGPADSASPHALLVEGLAVSSVLPGTLVTQTTAGIDVNSSAATVFGAQALVAVEQGSHVGATVDTAYAVGENVMAAQARSGEFFLVFVAAGNNILSKGTALSSNGDGSLKIAATDGTEQVLFHADEVVNVNTAKSLVLVRKA